MIKRLPASTLSNGHSGTPPAAGWSARWVSEPGHQRYCWYDSRNCITENTNSQDKYFYRQVIDGESFPAALGFGALLGVGDSSYGPFFGLVCHPCVTGGRSEAFNTPTETPGGPPGFRLGLAEGSPLPWGCLSRTSLAPWKWRGCSRSGAPRLRTSNRRFSTAVGWVGFRGCPRADRARVLPRLRR